MFVVLQSNLGKVFLGGAVFLHMFPAGVAKHLSGRRSWGQAVGVHDYLEVPVQGIDPVVELGTYMGLLFIALLF